MSSFVVVLVGAAFFVGAAQSSAHAQTPVKEPVIDRAPQRVMFDRDATITGHLENGTPGDEVALERRVGDGGWTQIRIQAVDADLKVRFNTRVLRRSSYFRLTYTDPASAAQTVSDARRVAVVPRLSLQLSSRNVMQGYGVTLWGRLLPVEAGRSVRVEQRVSGEWRTMERLKLRDGRFEMRFEARRKGFRRLRVVFGGDSHNTPTRRGVTYRVYSRALATWYGPGFYGNSTACGQRLTTETLGVAHRWLPCGTMVAVLYQGRTIKVPVIDRGPYSRADWDLTQETAERLRFSGTDTIGVDPAP
ncbi:MAG: septal ring lytic transglycosylase RlpA family protein [Actinomycetota bacterium]|nr:septal ring lytic transglycosylase RlpA family protein [Actinomycetota bacterium]